MLQQSEAAAIVRRRGVTRYRIKDDFPSVRSHTDFPKAERNLNFHIEHILLPERAGSYHLHVSFLRRFTYSLGTACGVEEQAILRPQFWCHSPSVLRGRIFLFANLLLTYRTGVRAPVGACRLPAYLFFGSGWLCRGAGDSQTAVSVPLSASFTRNLS